MRDQVEGMIRFGLTSEEIAARLAAAVTAGKLSWAPTGRTIRNWITAGRVRGPAKPDDPWSLITGHPDDLPLVIPAIPHVLALPPAARWLSVREAELIARVRKAAPDLPVAAAVTVSALYAGRESRRESTADLDLYLAGGPWRDGVDDVAYARLADRAGLPRIWVSHFQPGDVLVGVNSFSRATVTNRKAPPEDTDAR